ncbi:unnamed protein product [Rotaria magnacalcarata]|uniref:Uncharacterized protein n=3 Tax=Rotaria magnacalcarata TaxID=392030 RepID=A0A816YVN6_9BILA|nr:unnamed protein product [Rotaria magnacalcarata]CAF1648507.1 unnamed protein product [Rotaria magnacalcarata]CAF2126688.1 unnamed protein product [Rotaria magnacalcarata]CAF2133925.1 unnamed protein product [Rotaria magnacalcarata]CAF2163900.1 unnamed protein product [Rotaria magnacalcarata]
MATKNSTETGNNAPDDDIKRMGQTILRAKTVLIKPYSKYTEEGLRPRTPNQPYTSLTSEQVSNIERTVSPVFFHKAPITTATGAFRCFRQRQTDSYPMSHLRAGGHVGGGTEYTYVTAQSYTTKLPDEYNGCGENGFPKWYPNRAGERTLGHLRNGEPTERFVSIDMFRRAPTARSGQIIFDHGRPNDGYYLQRYGYNTTWFHSDLNLNRHNILDSIEMKATADYEQKQVEQQEQYRKANDIWPHLSEYSDQFVLKTKAEQKAKTDLEHAKQHIAQNPTRLSSLHNQIAARTVAQGRTLINEPSVTVQC